MTASMAGERARESARKKAMTHSIMDMVEVAEGCIQGAGGMEIISERLPRGIHGTRAPPRRAPAWTPRPKPSRKRRGRCMRI